MSNSFLIISIRRIDNLSNSFFRPPSIWFDLFIDLLAKSAMLLYYCFLLFLNSCFCHDWFLLLFSFIICGFLYYLRKNIQVFSLYGKYVLCWFRHKNPFAEKYVYYIKTPEFCQVPFTSKITFAIPVYMLIEESFKFALFADTRVENPINSSSGKKSSFSI